MGRQSERCRGVAACVTPASSGGLTRRTADHILRTSVTRASWQASCERHVSVTSAVRACRRHNLLSARLTRRHAKVAKPSQPNCTWRGSAVTSSVTRGRRLGRVAGRLKPADVRCAGRMHRSTKTPQRRVGRTAGGPCASDERGRRNGPLRRPAPGGNPRPARGPPVLCWQRSGQ